MARQFQAAAALAAGAEAVTAGPFAEWASEFSMKCPEFWPRVRVLDDRCDNCDPGGARRPDARWTGPEMAM